MKKILSKSIQYIVIVLLVVVSIWLTVKDVELGKLVSIIKNADYFWVVASIPIMLLSHWIRAIRWRTILKPIHPAKSTMNLFSAVMVGYAVNAVLPRVGEVVRPFVYARREKISKSAVFATIIVERFIDVIFLLGLFAIVFFLNRDIISTAMPSLTNQDIVIYSMTGVALLIVMLLSIYTSLGGWMLKICVKPFSHNMYEKLDAMLKSFVKGLEFIKSPSQYIRTIVESSLLWLFYALPMYIIFYSFNFQNHLNLGVLDAGLLLIVSGIGTTIAPTPGSVGVYHLMLQTAMVNLYGISKEEALAYATVVHAANLVVQMIVGFGFLFREKVSTISEEIHSHDMETSDSAVN